MDLGRFEGIAEKFAGIDFMSLLIEHGALIYDILIGFIFLIIIIGFAKKGLISTAAPIACVVLALGCGISMANTYTEQITDRVYAKMLGKVSEQLAPLLSQSGSYDMQEIISNGLPDQITEAVGLTTRTALSHTVHFAILGIVTVLAYIVFRLISKLLEGAADLPVIRFFDFLGGMVFGIAFCIVVFYLIVRISAHFGHDIFQRLSDGTIMLKWFTGVK